ncbi:MAG: prephenate dehydratase [Candidatus Bathyarchaeota archaeon]|nr:prephenate dehydratase [Candidatus Bathyarchaeota archaeon]
MRVAYQGVPGAYSEAAVIQHWGDAAEPIPRPYLEDVFSTVEAGEAEAGLVPVENTLEGSITRTYDLLNERSLTVLGETVFRVTHCLIANPGVKPQDIKRVYSHPQALGQTRVYLATHGYEPVNHFDTAGAVKMIRDGGLRDAAAVASRRAADIYGMSVLAEEIEDNGENYTRFLHIGRGSTQPTGRDKTSLAFTVDNRPGTLIAALRVLADRRLNLSKIESRPYTGRPWEYVFFIDFDGHREDHASADALRELAAYAWSLKVLGSYPRA